jgi:hypothetical protein
MKYEEAVGEIEALMNKISDICSKYDARWPETKAYYLQRILKHMRRKDLITTMSYICEVRAEIEKIISKMPSGDSLAATLAVEAMIDVVVRYFKEVPVSEWTEPIIS